jgi:hypothetical protein
MAQTLHAALVGHPANPPRCHERIDVTLTRTPAGRLTIAYAIHGLDSARIVPTPAAPAPADALWRSTCCELFLGPAGQPGYREFNFSPSGQWAAYDFSDYRQRLPTTTDFPPPSISVRHTDKQLQLDVEMPAAALPATANLRLALSVVLAAQDGSCNYWALAHPPGRADFHHHAGFVIKLDASGFSPVSQP